MRICFVSHLAGKDGAEMVLLEIVDALHKRGVVCDVVLPQQGPLVNDLLKRGIAAHIVPYRWWSSPQKNTPQRLRTLARNLVTSIKLARYLKAHRCDLVYSNTIVVPVGAFAAALSGLPHVWHIQEFGNLDHSLKFDWGERFTLSVINKLSAVCITNSMAVTDYFSHFIDFAKLRLVYYSMHLAGSQKSETPQRGQNAVASNRAYRCVLVGRITEKKGQQDAVLALAELVRSGIRAELYLVGGGSPADIEHLQKLVATHRLTEQVVFTGRLDDPAEITESADVVLVCSHSEAFGRVTVEGMLAGKPLIGARGGATPELIRHGFNGLLYTPGNAQELAANIRYLYENRMEADRMAVNGFYWARGKFSERQLAEDLLSVLNSIVVPTQFTEARTA